MNKTSMNNVAVGLMALAAVLFSMVPVMMKWGNAHEFPFLFIGTSQIVKVIVISLVLCLFFSKFLYNAKDVIRENMFVKPTRMHCFVFGFAFFDYALFAIAAHFISYAAVSIIFQLSIVLFVAYTAFLYRGTLRYSLDITSTALLMLFSFTGVALVLYSQHGEFLGDNQENLFYGGLVALLAAFFVCFDAHCLIWATKTKDDHLAKNSKALNADVEHEFFKKFNNKQKTCFLELLFVNVLYVAGSAFALISVIGVWFMTHEFTTPGFAKRHVNKR